MLRADIMKNVQLAQRDTINRMQTVETAFQTLRQQIDDLDQKTKKLNEDMEYLLEFLETKKAKTEEIKSG